jgi:hypothetical protein
VSADRRTDVDRIREAHAREPAFRDAALARKRAGAPASEAGRDLLARISAEFFGGKRSREYIRKLRHIYLAAIDDDESALFNDPPGRRSATSRPPALSRRAAPARASRAAM